ncbi:hypothetical protein IMCC3135_20360 [Granulosicoccus antarcticus IMCC3135]|uniref:SnoaL-like domain-containing protein n=2 Tax=Granulosicoccus TaxID=437504 RepID=A0A2Z2NZ61_9GAMM|nr:hypothetical protein IMCC3135_20360 [Granulosicoccus antarcticus IMCC3135]
MAFMGAMGAGEMEKMMSLMADNMVWHNEGDKSMPWIGPWEGKEAILKFLPVFCENFQTTQWENTDAFASGDTVAVFGKMNGITTHSGKEIGEFTFALRAKVRDGQVVLWHWFEDSFAVRDCEIIKYQFSGVPAPVRQGVRRANSRLFNRRTTQQGRMQGRLKMIVNCFTIP